MEDYKPLLKSLTIKKSNIDGLGLFAVEDIIQDNILGVSHVYDIRFPQHLIRTPLGAFINHSETPNCDIVQEDDLYYLWTLTPIKKGEELTVNYRDNECGQSYSFICETTT